MVDALTYGTATLKPSDDFDRDAFLSFVVEQRDMDRGGPADIQRALQQADQIHRDRWEARDPWAKLFVDWDEMHPDARTILDDPQDWGGHEVSPHGNDTGANVFADWTAYQGLAPEQAAAQNGWGPEFDFSDALFWKDWVEINLALAFGHIKKTGSCPERLARAVQSVIEQELARSTKGKNGEHHEDYMAALTRYNILLASFA